MATTTVKKRKISPHRETAAFPDKILMDFMVDKNKKSLKNLKGKISFRDDYDYKSMRS